MSRVDPKFRLFLLAAIFGACVALGDAGEVCGQGDGLLARGSERLFPIGFYELPKGEENLQAMAEAGVNLVRCGTRADLDRVQAVGMMGWLSLGIHAGATEDLQKRVDSVKDHPALAVWEGPDEIVWNFTAAPALHGKEGMRGSDWWHQTPQAVAYSERQAETILPNIRAGIELVRRLDDRDRQFWINEALYSDVKFVRQYMDDVDITGCDFYPVGHDPISRMGTAVERWKRIGRGKPVWMVLQAFAWSELGGDQQEKRTVYPTFAESRFMAYVVISHGAKGILYWGSQYLKSADFRQSLYALTSELAALQPFLVAAEEKGVQANVIEVHEKGQQNLGVRVTVRRVGREWLIVLVNEDDRKHMGVEVVGLEDLDGHRLELLYGTENATVHHGEFVTRLQPFEVKVFAASRKWETPQRAGRDFAK